jgi:Holliday junction resolvase-like predicted endonuclease
MSSQKQFQPIPDFSFEINRAERSHQVRWLVPLLDRPEGSAWFLERLQCPCTPDEARAADVFHLCFPLRDIFTADYYQCRGTPHLEDQFIAYYNRLFGLPEDFGLQEVWRTAPGGEIRHPAAGGRAGWYDDFLRERVPDQALQTQARNVRRMLGTEADVLLLTDRHAVLVECKYKSEPSTEQYERHQMMGKTLARRLEKAFHFGMVVEDERDPRFARIDVPHVLWSEIQSELQEIVS